VAFHGLNRRIRVFNKKSKEIAELKARIEKHYENDSKWDAEELERLNTKEKRHQDGMKAQDNIAKAIVALAHSVGAIANVQGKMASAKRDQVEHVKAQDAKWAEEEAEYKLEQAALKAKEERGDS